MSRTARRAFRPSFAPLEGRITPTLPAGFALGAVASGLAGATAMAVAPDGRIFVAEQSGTIAVIDNGQVVTFATLPDVDSSGGRGLLGIAIDPLFEATHRVFVFYTTTDDPASHNRVAYLVADVTSPDGDTALPNSEVDLLDLPALGSNTSRNGGAIHFAVDGTLLIGVGDDGNAQAAQALNSTLGKILRVNRDGTVPTDDPFYGQAGGINRSIYAVGFGNPATFAVDPLSGRVYVNDNGGSTLQQVFDVQPGSNAGSPLSQGPTTDPRFLSPIVSYAMGISDTTGDQVMGGAFYTPDTGTFPYGYYDTYFFADSSSKWIRRYDPTTGAVSAFATGLPGNPVDLAVEPGGDLLFLITGANGSVLSIRSTVAPSVPPQIINQPVDQVGVAGGSATFRVDATGTSPLSYQWQRDGVNIPGATGSSYTINPVATTDYGATFRVIVVNQASSVTSATATLSPDALWIGALYRDVLGRAPDVAGWNANILADAASPGRGTAVAAIVNSSEAHADFVAGLYQTYLDRPADAGGLAFYVGLLDAGVGRESIRASILGSDEYFALHGGTADGFVRALYSDALGRAADPQGEALYVGLVGSGGRAAVVGALLASAEYQARTISGYYSTYLRRQADAGGLALYLGQVQMGVPLISVLESILAGPEYVAESS